MPDVISLKRDCDAIEIPSGAPAKLTSGTVVRIVQSRGASYTVSTHVGAMYRIDGKDAPALGLAPPAISRSPTGPLTDQMVADQLKTVFDPEIPVNIVDLGLVYECSIHDAGADQKRIEVKMAMTAPGCGMSNVLKADVERKLSSLPDVREVRVEIVFDPPWHPGRMSEAAKLQLGLDDLPPAPFPLLR